MCWNEPVSWLTFTIGTASSIVLYLYGQKKSNNSVKAIAIMWFFAILMQFFEALIHRERGKCGDLGKFATHGAFWANILQPVSVVVAVMLLNRKKLNSKQVATLFLLLVYLTVFTVFYVQKNRKGKFPCAKKASCKDTKGTCHINLYWWNWGRILSILYLACLFFAIFYFIEEKKLRNFSLIFVFGTLILSRFYRQGPSIWCWFAAFGPIATLLYLHFRK